MLLLFLTKFFSVLINRSYNKFVNFVNFCKFLKVEIITYFLTWPWPWSPPLSRSPFTLRSSAKFLCLLLNTWKRASSFWAQLCSCAPRTVYPCYLAAFIFCSVSFSWLWMEETVAAYSRLTLMGSVVFRLVPVSFPVLWFMSSPWYPCLIMAT